MEPPKSSRVLASWERHPNLQHPVRLVLGRLNLLKHNLPLNLNKLTLSSKSKGRSLMEFNSRCLNLSLQIK